MRILIAQASAAAKGGAENYAAALRHVLINDGHAVGTIDVRGHTPPGGKHSRLPLAITGRALWNWAQVCRALPKIALDYDRVILAYGEGPPLPVPTLTLRHSPTLFATDARLLACVGARPTGVRRAYIQLCRRVAGPIAGPHQTTTLCNTRWTAQICADVAGFPSDGILYPKVDRPTAPLNMRKPYRVLILGRIVPNKRIEDAIAVCETLHLQGFPIEVEVLGRADSRYARRLVAQLSRKAHVRVTPNANGATRARALAEARFGLHMFRGEHFGIAVAEMILHGVTPLVFDDGGICELVTTPQLRFRDTREAASKLAALCLRPDRADRMLTDLQRGAALNAAVNFDENALHVLRDWLDEGWVRHAAQ